jgi:hypothetical protein
VSSTCRPAERCASASGILVNIVTNNVASKRILVVIGLPVETREGVWNDAVKKIVAVALVVK